MSFDLKLRHFRHRYFLQWFLGPDDVISAAFTSPAFEERSYLILERFALTEEKTNAYLMYLSRLLSHVPCLYSILNKPTRLFSYKLFPLR